MATKPAKRLTDINVKKDIFVEPMGNCATVIHNKMSDAMSLNVKAQTWDKLGRERNDIDGVRPRGAQDLTELWETLKDK